MTEDQLAKLAEKIAQINLVQAEVAAIQANLAAIQAENAALLTRETNERITALHDRVIAKAPTQD